MLSIERTKELLRNPSLSDREAEEIRNISYMLAELIFDNWRAEQLHSRISDIRYNEEHASDNLCSS